MTAEVAQSAAEQQPVPEKKNFDVIKVIVEKVTGTVKWFSINRHYGFIQRDDNKEDVFVHRSAITATKARYPTLKNGEVVEFSVVETPSGINAASVTGPNGQNVQGIRFFRRRYRSSQANSGGHSNMNGGTSQAGEDGDEGRPARGGGRMRRGRRYYRGPSQNGGSGDNEAVQGEGEQNGEGGGSRPPRQQRPRRYRGGRGGRPRSTSTRHPGEAIADGEEQIDAGGEGSRPPARRGGRGGGRRGGRFRRGGARNGGPQRTDGEETGENNGVSQELQAETKPVAITASESKPTEDRESTDQYEKVTDLKTDNLEAKMDKLSLDGDQGENAKGGNGEGAPANVADDNSN